MKYIYTLFFIPFVYIILGISVITICFGTVTGSNLGTATLDTDNSNVSNQTELVLAIDKNKGVLIVKVTTINGDEGMNNSSDFIVNVHANNPVPATFKGNLTGTIVELSMGMYSITISSIPSYNTSLSSDCAGGIMKVETAYCNIVNTYIKS
ncbi:MAG: hypothetical protein M3Q77_05225 [Thermoproteota archaeon]|nr:hypothetical protein [Thermoproteota archaeon]